MNGADTVFVLMSAALVMLMMPGLAFFYGGLVRRKNILSVLMQCFAMLGVITIQWFMFGYSLSFGPSSGFWGGLQWAGLQGVGGTPFVGYSATIPHLAFMIFQAMFAIITPALIIGAFAERMKFSAFLLFSVLWATFVYDPVCHWVWGIGGWLRQLGMLDFAGGAVVHITAGSAALVTALVIGKRKGFGKKPMPPHNLPFAVLGAGLLWFGWFGFNAGSALSIGAVAVGAFTATHAAAAAGACTWALIEWIIVDRPTIFGTITGAVAGLATVTPAAGFVSPLNGMFIAAFASAVCFVFVTMIKPRLGYDDSLDAFGVHGVGGFLGTVLTGIFASTIMNPAGADGALFGNMHQLYVQLFGAAVVALYTMIVTFVLFKVVDLFVGLRVDDREENIGLDLTEHHEAAYTVIE